MSAGSGAGANTRDSGALRYRVATAVVGLPLVLWAVWVGGIPLYVFVSVVAVAAAVETNRLLNAPRGPFLYLTPALALVLLAAAFQGVPMWLHLAIGVIAGGLLLRRIFSRGNAGAPRTAPMVSRVAAPLYPAAFLSFGLALHNAEVAAATQLGASWLLAALLLVFASDTSAYGVGRLIGLHRLAPRISPGKTWEGAVGALVGTSVVSVMASVVLPLSTEGTVDPAAAGDLAAFAAVGIAISVLAQTGDLFLSAVKRTAGAKESGGLLPGHGGVLDRLDSILPVLPAVYYGLQWVS